MSMSKFLIRPLAAAVLCAMGASQAAVTVYTTPASFLAAVTAASTDTFAGFSFSEVTVSPIIRAVGPYGYTASSTAGFFGAGTSGDPYLSTNVPTDPIGFGAMTGSPSAIGGNFFDSNIYGLYAAGAVIVAVVDSLGGTSSQTIAPSAALTGSFLGFVSTGLITSLTVASIQGASPLWPTVDNLTLAAAVPVPEPGTCAMFLAGVGALGFVARRRRG